MFIELRRYIVDPDHRDEWVQIMEEKVFPFIQPLGVVVLGSFVGFHDKGQFVWLRSFENDTEHALQYKAIYESKFWLEEIIPLVDKWIEWEEIKNVKLHSQLNTPAEGSLFIDYKLEKDSLVDLNKFKVKDGKMEEWLNFLTEKLIPLMNSLGGNVLDCYTLPNFKDTCIVMTQFESFEQRNVVNEAIANQPTWIKGLQLLNDVADETPFLKSTDTSKFM